MNTIDSSDLQQIHNAIDNLLNAMTDEGTQNLGVQVTRIIGDERYVNNYSVNLNIQFTPKEEPVVEEDEEPEVEEPTQPEQEQEPETPTEPEPVEEQTEPVEEPEE